MGTDNAIIISICVFRYVSLCVDSAILPDTDGNLFYQTHTQIFGNRTACYPLARSVEALFIATPGWLPHQLFTIDTSGEPCREQIGYFRRGIQGRCIELTEPGTSGGSGPQRAQGHGSYTECFQGQGWGCAYALVPTNNPCAQMQCVQQHCQIQEGHFTCVCQQQRCIASTAGRQFVCGICNSTHISSASWAYPVDSYQGVGSNGESGDGGRSTMWHHRIERPRGTVCYRAK